MERNTSDSRGRWATSRLRRVRSATGAGWPALSTPVIGWPGPVPEVEEEHAMEIWNVVYNQCRRFGIPDDAVAVYQGLADIQMCLPHNMLRIEEDRGRLM